MKSPRQPLTSHALQKSDLHLLVGEWEVSSPQFPGPTGRAIFEWLEGSAYLIFRSIAPDPAPSSIWVIGADDSSESYTALYCDARGVSRVYHMSLHHGLWKMWREAPDFSQRFTAQISEGAQAIQGAWEMARDGTHWKHDFDLLYRKVK